MSRLCASAALWGLVSAALVASPGCDYRARHELLYARSDLSTPVFPDAGGGTDAEPVDPSTTALYMRQCESCHPDLGRSASPSGPVLAGVLRHNSRAVTLDFIRFGGGEMESFEAAISAQQAEDLLDLLALYGEGFEPPPTGDAATGQVIFESACADCHVDGGARESLIPELDPVAARISREFFTGMLQRATGDMPATPLASADEDAVWAYLQQLAAGGGAAAPAAFEESCASCHVEGGRRRLRVTTVGEGGRLAPGALRTLCVQGQGNMPGVLPALDDAAALDLQAYLATVAPLRPAPGQWPPVGFAAPDPAASARGAGVYTERCAVCHGEGDSPPPLWPHLRDAGTLHSPAYLAEITAEGGGDMPAFEELGAARIAALADYLEALSAALAASEEPPEAPVDFVTHCQGCHGAGGRTPVQAPGLTHAGRDLSATRLTEVLAAGLGDMAAVTLTEAERGDLLAFFRQGLGDAAPQPEEVALARTLFDTHCATCHLDGGLTSTRVPGLGDLMGRASSDYLAQVVSEGLGWMPRVDVSVASVAMLDAGLRQVAAGQAMEPGRLTIYERYCESCHRRPTVGDAVPAVAAPSLLDQVGGRLSPAFIDSLLGGLGTMGAVAAGDGTGALLRPYLESIAGAAANPDTGLPAGADGAASRQAFGRLCEGCHREQGEETVLMPTLARRLELLSWEYVGAFVTDPYGDMPRLALDAAEQARIEAYYVARHDRQAVPDDAREAYERRCQGCHPAYHDQDAVVVPHLVPTGARLSARAVVQISQAGAGAMAPAYTAAGVAPSEAEVTATFTHLVTLAGRVGRPWVQPALDADLVSAGRGLYQRHCGSMMCHGVESVYDLAAHVDRGRSYSPLQGLSATLLRGVLRSGRGVEEMPAYPVGVVSEPEMDALVEYLQHLGQGNAL